MSDRRRALLGASGGRLPAWYQEVEYLEGHGTEYIALDFPLEFGETVSFDIRFLSSYSPVIIGSAPTLFGLAQSNPRRAIFTRIGKQDDTEIYTIVTSFNSVSTVVAIIRSTEPFKTYTYVRDESGYHIIIQDSEFFISSSESAFTPTTLYPFIFAQNSYNSPGRILGEGVGIHEIKISNKFYGISCYRKSDRKPGMYDLVNSTFYINQGTGEFTIGPAI